MLKDYCIFGRKVENVERPKIVTSEAQTQPDVISLAFR
jgi:hypothetical protein